MHYAAIVLGIIIFHSPFEHGCGSASISYSQTNQRDLRCERSHFSASRIFPRWGARKSSGGYLGVGINAEIAQNSLENYLQYMNPISDFALREALKGIIYALTSDGIYQPDIEWNGASEDLYLN